MRPSRVFILIPLITLSAFIVGCANLNSVHRELKVSEGTGALIDIKQRAIFVSKKTDDVIVCAEPSPDSLSAYAAELAAKAQIPNGVTAQLSGAFKESASFTGLRTQSIQLLRDSLYRICEAYMNGAINQGQYGLLVRRYQKYTVALLAIEQLTGAIKAPPVTINTNGSAEADRSISEMRTVISGIDKQISDLEKKKSDQSTTEDEKKSIDENIKSFKSDKEAVSKSIENAKGTLSFGSAIATVSSVGLPTQRSDQNMQAVTAAVEHIVMSIIDTDDTGQLCFLQMQLDPKNLSEGDKKLQLYCEKIMDINQAAASLQLKVLQGAYEDLNKSKDDSDKKAAEAKRIADQIEKIKSQNKSLSVPSFKLPTE